MAIIGEALICGSLLINLHFWKRAGIACNLFMQNLLEVCILAANFSFPISKVIIRRTIFLSVQSNNNEKYMIINAYIVKNSQSQLTFLCSRHNLH